MQGEVKGGSRIDLNYWGLLPILPALLPRLQPFDPPRTEK